MFAVSYVIIFAFHPKLTLGRVIIERSFGHSERELTNLNYLICEQLSFKDNNILLQLKNRALNVLAKNRTYTISEMFSTELKFAADCLLAWFNKKFKNNNLELSIDATKKLNMNSKIQLIGNLIHVVFVLFHYKYIHLIRLISEIQRNSLIVIFT